MRAHERSAHTRRSSLVKASVLLRASAERQRQKHLDRRLARAEATLHKLLATDPTLPASTGMQPELSTHPEQPTLAARSDATINTRAAAERHARAAEPPAPEAVEPPSAEVLRPPSGPPSVWPSSPSSSLAQPAPATDAAGADADTYAAGADVDTYAAEEVPTGGADLDAMGAGQRRAGRRQEIEAIASAETQLLGAMLDAARARS